MLPVVGFIDLREADAIWYASLTYTFMNDTTVYTTATGTYKTLSEGTVLTGTDTLATTELPANQNIELDYNIGKVVSTPDDFTVNTDTSFDAPDDSILKILTPEQRTTLEALWLKKTRALQSSYDLILAFINVPSTIPDVLKKAQAFLAGNLFYKQGKSTTLNQTDKNVIEYAIGDMSYKFKDSISLSGNSAYEIFPEPIYTMLFPYLKNGRVFADVTTSAR